MILAAETGIHSLSAALLDDAQVASLKPRHQVLNRSAAVGSIPQAEMEHDIFDQAFSQPLVRGLVVADHDAHRHAGQIRTQQVISLDREETGGNANEIASLGQPRSDEADGAFGPVVSIHRRTAILLPL